MPVFVAWLYRAVPLIVGLVVLGIIVYVVLWNSRGAEAAKQAFSRIFWWVCMAGTVAFAIVALYAFGEHNTGLAEFFAICSGTMAVFWGVDTLFGYLLRRQNQERRIANMARPASQPDEKEE